MSNTITVIIPVHELNEVTTTRLSGALESIKTQKVQPEKVMVVVPEDTTLDQVVRKINEEVLLENLTIVKNGGATDFSSQLNYGVSKTETTHFMFLEFDDTLTDIWVDNVKKYMEAYPNVDMFLPIIANVDEDGKLLGLTNEPVWANEFSDKLGELDTETLLRYNDFNFDGMVMSKEKYEEFGGLKPSMKLVFPLEFMLRVTELGGVIMVVPKIGYRHWIQREGSLFEVTKDKMSVDERRWWLALAKKEYFHVKDRNIIYEKEE